MARIGLIGVGHMGGPIGANLIRAGHALSVFDLNAEAVSPLAAAGAAVAASVVDAAQGADFVLTVLPGPAEVRSVVFGGVLEAMAEGSLYADLSTGEPGLARELARDFAAKGIGVLDAPISGGAHGARAATLAVYVGGSAADYALGLPVLQAIGRETCIAAGRGRAR